MRSVRIAIALVTVFALGTLIGGFVVLDATGRLLFTTLFPLSPSSTTTTMSTHPPFDDLPRWLTWLSPLGECYSLMCAATFVLSLLAALAVGALIGTLLAMVWWRRTPAVKSPTAAHITTAAPVTPPKNKDD